MAVSSIIEESFNLKTQFIFTPQGSILAAINGDFITAKGVKYSPKIKKSFTQNETAVRGQFLVRWICKGDVVCAKKLIGTADEYWWLVDSISPFTHVIYDKNLAYSCPLADAIPLRAVKDIVLPKVFKEDEYVYEKWWMEATGLHLEERQRAVIFMLSTLNGTERLSAGLDNFYPDSLD